MAKNDTKTQLPAPETDYDKKQKEYDRLVELCLDAIGKYHVLCIKDLAAFSGVCRSKLYQYQIEKNELIKEAIYLQKTIMAQGALNNLAKMTENPTAQIVVYKACVDAERRAAISNYAPKDAPEEENKNTIKSLFESFKRSRIERND